jgi:tRNA (Thr-GGU) A37 N-methylase
LDFIRSLSAPSRAAASRIGPIEAIDGTPVVDIKPVLAAGRDF